MERSRDNRKEGMSGPYTPISKHTAENKSIGIYGVSEREKQSDDIPKIWEYEICIPEQRILVQRVLCRYNREKHSSNTRIH